MGGWGWTMNFMWDGITSGNNMCHTNPFNSFPVSFTFDLGITTKYVLVTSAGLLV